MGVPGLISLATFCILFLESLVLAAPVNDTLFLPSSDLNATNSTGDLKAHFASFATEDYICSGLVSDADLDGGTASQAIEATIYKYLHGRFDQSHRIRKDSRYIDYAGLEGGVRVKVEFQMDPGVLLPLSIYDSAVAIQQFTQGLRQQDNLDHHQLRLSIFKEQPGPAGARQRLISITVEIEQGETVSVTTPNLLEFRGKLYPHRRLATQDVNTGLATIVHVIRQQGLDSRVPYGWDPVVSSRQVDIALNFWTSEPPEFPHFAFSSLLRLVQNVQNFFNARGYAAPMVGSIYHDRDQIGTLTIKAKPQLSGLTDSMSSSASNGTDITKSSGGDGVVQTS